MNLACKIARAIHELQLHIYTFYAELNKPFFEKSIWDSGET